MNLYVISLKFILSDHLLLIPYFCPIVPQPFNTDYMCRNFFCIIYQLNNTLINTKLFHRIKPNFFCTRGQHYSVVACWSRLYDSCFWISSCFGNNQVHMAVLVCTQQAGSFSFLLYVLLQVRFYYKLSFIVGLVWL